ncbi:MAG: LysE family translocator [Caulobacteraceae bacterium]|nr:LysE family translocator [Caulobacteraceae bacterium]
MTLPVDPGRFGAFVATIAVLSVTPGPANVFAVATGMQRGKAAALVGVLGMNAATLVWFLAAALGLGALVTAFPALFRWVAVGGGLYVAWLGLKALSRAWRDKVEAVETVTAARSRRGAFVDGFTVQIANPKAVLFFSAVLPPFLDVVRPVPPQLVMFGAATIFFDLLAMSAYGLGGAALARFMNEARFRRGFEAFVGVLLLTSAALILSRQVH